MKKSVIIYLIYLVLILSITALLSVQILQGKIKAPPELEKAAKPIKEIIGETQEDKLIRNFKKLDIAKKLDSCGIQSINSLGFKDDEWQIEKLPNTFRIIAFGDSFTEENCVKNEHMWPNQLKKKLNVWGSSLKFEVFNMGKSASGTYEEVKIFKELGLKYNPDMVILQYFVNDFESPEVAIKGRKLLEKYKNGEYELPSKIEKTIKESDSEEGTISQLIYSIVQYEYFSTANPEEEFNKWVRTPLIELIEICEDKDIKLMVIIIPDPYGKQLDYNDKLISILQDYNIPFYDFTDILLSESSSSLWRLEGHLTSSGYEFVANKTLETIRKNIKI